MVWRYSGVLLEVTYPGVAHITAADPLLDAWFSERTILCARNDDVDDLNSKILDKFPGQLKTFRSADKAIIEEGADQIAAHYSTEYLNSINASGLPLAEPKLKIGCPVMILQNLDPTNGLCNGAQAILINVTQRVLEVRLIGGQHAGKCAFIP